MKRDRFNAIEAANNEAIYSPKARETIRRWLSGDPEKVLIDRTITAQALRKVKGMSTKPIGPWAGRAVADALVVRGNLRLPPGASKRIKEAVKRHYSV